MENAILLRVLGKRKLNGFTFVMVEVAYKYISGDEGLTMYRILPIMTELEQFIQPLEEDPGMDAIANVHVPYVDKALRGLLQAEGERPRNIFIQTARWPL